MSFKDADYTLPHTYHRFIDEAGDYTFFGKGGLPIIGTPGVSKAFILGMAHFKEPLPVIREKITNFIEEVCEDPYFNQIPSIRKRINAGAFYLHANEDPPELRFKFFELLRNDVDFRLQAVVGRKDVTRFVNKHNRQEKEFYADLLSRLLFDKANYEKLVINIASLGNTVRNQLLEEAVLKAKDLHIKSNPKREYGVQFNFNVQPYKREPLLAVADYGLWAVQRVFEKGETRFYDALSDKIKHVNDTYGPYPSKKGRANTYKPGKPLTKDLMIT